MLALLTFGSVVSFSLLFVPKALALVPLVPIILIPLSQIVAFLLASLTLPATLFGFSIGKILNKPSKKLILLSLFVMLVMVGVTAIIIYNTVPNIPLF